MGNQQQDFVEYFGYIVYPDGRVFGKRGVYRKWVVTPKGYAALNLRINGAYKMFLVHRLVALCFMPNPENKPEIDHINGNRLDNRVENLRWVTRSENVQHSYNLGNKTSTGVKNGRCKTTEEDVHKICEYIANGLKPAEIRDLGFDYLVVRSIATKKNWRSISEKYF